MKAQTFIIILLLLLGPAHSLKAQLSPGPLSEPHAHLSGMLKCLSCHSWGDRDLSPKCLDCHAPIQIRIAADSGFHGQLTDTNCVICHSDHVGREFKMIHWDPGKDEFDHSRAGFELDGEHLKLQCETCHTREYIKADDILEYAGSVTVTDVMETTFLGLGSACVDCHADVHHEEFADQTCQECHSTRSWVEVRETFDHTERTKFPLKAAHAEVACKKCHTSSQTPVKDFQVQRFGGLKFELCTDCHTDEHQGSFGTDCLECHTESSFKISDRSGAFDHNKTRYRLLGEHQNVPCNDCHTAKGQFELTQTFDQCSDCHTDHHQGAFSRSDRDLSCDQCHSSTGFFPPLYGVDEHSKSNFPLEGAHLAQPCVFCHKQGDEAVYQWESTRCEICHENSHGSQFSEYLEFGAGCEECHRSSDWVDLVFDHQNSSFPLTGAHLKTGCSACHKPQDDIIQYEGLATSCSNCHKDAHATQFAAQDCQVCHETTSWKIPEFDHQTSTEFPLDGQHAELSCGQCHKFESTINTIRFSPIAHRCQDCHGFGDSQ